MEETDIEEFELDQIPLINTNQPVRKLQRLKRATAESSEGKENQQLDENQKERLHSPKKARKLVATFINDAADETAFRGDAPSSSAAGSPPASNSAEPNTAFENEDEAVGPTDEDYWDEEDEYEELVLNGPTEEEKSESDAGSQDQGSDHAADNQEEVSSQHDGDGDADTQRLLRESAVREALGRNHQPVLIPLNGVLQKIKERSKQAKETSRPSPLPPTKPDFNALMAQIHTAANAGAACEEDEDELELVDDGSPEDDSLNNTAEALPDDGEEEGARLHDDSQSPTKEEDATKEVCCRPRRVSVDGEQNDAKSPAVRDDRDEPPTAVHHAGGDTQTMQLDLRLATEPQPTFSADADMDSGAEEEPLMGGIDKVASDEVEDAEIKGMEEEDGAVASSDSDQEEGPAEQHHTQQGGEAEGQGGMTHKKEPQSHLLKANRKAEQNITVHINKDLFDMEAELSEDGEHLGSDDEDDSDVEDGVLADLIDENSAEQEGEEEDRAELHTKWLAEQEKEALRNIIHGVKNGFRRGGTGLDDVEGSDKLARLRRAAMRGDDEDDDVYDGQQHMEDDTLWGMTEGGDGLDALDWLQRHKQQKALQQSQQGTQKLKEVLRDEHSQQILQLLSGGGNLTRAASGRGETQKKPSSFLGRSSSMPSVTVRTVSGILGAGNASRSFVFGRDDSNSALGTDAPQVKEVPNLPSSFAGLKQQLTMSDSAQTAPSLLGALAGAKKRQQHAKSLKSTVLHSTITRIGKPQSGQQ